MHCLVPISVLWSLTFCDIHVNSAESLRNKGNSEKLVLEPEGKAGGPVSFFSLAFTEYVFIRITVDLNLSGM